MSGELITETPEADVLVEEIIGRYGSIAQFCDVLRRDLDDPTVELPCIPAVYRQRQYRPAPPPPPPNRPADTTMPRAATAWAPPTAHLPMTNGTGAAEANRRRGFWRRFIDRWRL